MKIIESRTYRMQSGYGRFATFSDAKVDCVEQRGKFYASMNTLNASHSGVGDTPDAAFSDWEKKCAWNTVRLVSSRGEIVNTIENALTDETGSNSSGPDCEAEVKPLPPDPEGMNDKRTLWAENSLVKFMSLTGVDREDSLADLLTDLMHWADRNEFDFQTELERAQRNYAEETT